MVKENKYEREYRKKGRGFQSEYKIKKKHQFSKDPFKTHKMRPQPDSDKPSFEISICDKTTKKKLLELDVKTERYVIARQNQAFIVRFESSSDAVFGMRLYIDGQLACPPRTFKRTGKVIGFRETSETFREFKFDIPKVEFSENLSEADRERLLKSGVIRCDFLKTRETFIEGEIKPKKADKATQFLAVKRLCEKKYFTKSLAITKGDVFQRKQNLNFLKKNYNPRTGNSVTYMIEKDQLIQTVELRYADFNALLLMGHLSVYNVEHLKYIPMEQIKSNQYLVRTIFISLLAQAKDGLGTNELKEKFREHTQKNFESLGLGDISYFFGSFEDFTLSNGKIFYRKSESFIAKTIKDLKPNNLVARKYYENALPPRQANPSLRNFGIPENPIVLDG